MENKKSHVEEYLEDLYLSDFLRRLNHLSVLIAFGLRIISFGFDLAILFITGSKLFIRTVDSYSYHRMKEKASFGMVRIYVGVFDRHMFYISIKMDFLSFNHPKKEIKSNTNDLVFFVRFFGFLHFICFFII